MNNPRDEPKELSDFIDDAYKLGYNQAIETYKLAVLHGKNPMLYFIDELSRIDSAISDMEVGDKNG